MPLEQLLDTPEYQFDKTVTAGLEKYPKVRDAFDGAWGTILAASNADRIEIVHDSYLEGSIKESTRIGTANEEPIETLNCIEEEADSRIALHTPCAAKKDFRQFLFYQMTPMLLCTI